MSDAKIPEGLHFTKGHEWAKPSQGGAGAEITVGITAFAVEQLGDITLVNLDVKAGDTVTAGKAFGTIESVKTLSDLFAPVSGKVLKVNAELDSKPESVNEDTYGKGWMVVIAPTDTKDVAALMDSKTYAEYCKTQAH